MRGRRDLEEFVAARTQELHHDAFVLTASQDQAERLVAVVLAAMSRERADFSQAATTTGLRMARTAAHLDGQPTEAGEVATRFRTLATIRTVCHLLAVRGGRMPPQPSSSR